MITKKIVDNQLYVMYNGTVIFKKWLKTGESIVFENYGFPTRTSDRNENAIVLRSDREHGQDRGSGSN